MADLKKYEIALKKDLFEVTDALGNGYGGSQNWSRNSNLKKYGCGVVACADVILYLKNRDKESFSISREEFLRFCDFLKRTYFPIIPGVGVNSLAMTAGMTAYLRRNHLGSFAWWKLLRLNFWDELAGMLKNDIPAVLGIGKNFPNIFGRVKLQLYVKNENGYTKAASTLAHYVVITAMDAEWIAISSWGRKYYINKTEFEKYVRYNSCSVLSNIMLIRQG